MHTLFSHHCIWAWANEMHVPLQFEHRWSRWNTTEDNRRNLPLRQNNWKCQPRWQAPACWHIVPEPFCPEQTQTGSPAPSPWQWRYIKLHPGLLQQGKKNTSGHGWKKCQLNTKWSIVSKSFWFCRAQKAPLQGVKVSPRALLQVTDSLQLVICILSDYFILPSDKVPQLCSHCKQRWWRRLCTFGLDLFTVGRNNDTLNLVQLHVLGDLSETHDQAALGFRLGGILLVHSLLEANQLLQEESHALVDLLAQYLVTVPGRKKTCKVRGNTGQSCTITSHQTHFIWNIS